MSNNYSTVPAVIPGDLRVQGKLTVASSQFILGQFPRKYRIQEIASGQFVETVNLDRIAVLQDDATSISQTRTIQPAAAPFSLATEAAGAPATDTFLLVWTGTAFQVIGQELRVGAAIPYMRVYASPPNGGGLSANLASDGVTRDDVTKVGLQYVLNATANQIDTTLRDLAGNSIVADPRRVFWYDHAAHTVSGVTGVQTIGSKTIYGNQFGPAGGIFLRLGGSFNTSATGTIVLGLTFGGLSQGLLTLPASLGTNWWTHLVLANKNATNSQVLSWSGGWHTGSCQIALTSATIDTTVNQPLAVTVNPSDTASSVTVGSIEAEFISRLVAI